MTLPVEYQEVEYIESSWATYQAWQYIDTWFTFTENAWQIKMKVMPTSFWSNYYDYRCGGSVQQWGTNRAFVLYLAYSTPYIWLWSNDLSTWKSVSVNNIYEWDIQANSGSVNYSVNWDTGSATYSWGLVNGKNYYIFCNFEGNTWHYYHANMKLYYFQIYQSWTLVRDFIPCYRKSDNVIWMYDLVNDVFYTNAWTWTFTKWPDILPPVPKFTLHWAIQTFHWKRPYEWKPWANTLLYYDFENDSWTTVTNKGTWWSTMNWTASWITFETLSSWKKVAQNTSSSRNNWIMSNWTQTVPSSVTQWCWIKSSSSTSSRSWVFGFWWNAGSYLLDCNANGAWTQFIWYKALPSPEAWVFFALNSTSSTDGNWHLVTWTYDSVNGNKFYIDAQEKTMTRNQWSTSSDPTVLQAMNIRIMQSNSTGNDWSFVWQCWCYWIEDKSWTSEDIANYYNQTKWDYWIS